MRPYVDAGAPMGAPAIWFRAQINKTLHLSSTGLLWPASPLAFIPDRNSDRVIGVPSCSSKLPNVFLKRSRSLKALHKNSLQAGQLFCYPDPNELMQGSHNTLRKYIGYVEILQCSKWK